MRSRSGPKCLVLLIAFAYLQFYANPPAALASSEACRARKVRATINAYSRVARCTLRADGDFDSCVQRATDAVRRRFAAGDHADECRSLTAEAVIGWALEQTDDFTVAFAPVGPAQCGCQPFVESWLRTQRLITPQIRLCVGRPDGDGVVPLAALLGEDTSVIAKARATGTCSFGSGGNAHPDNRCPAVWASIYPACPT